MIDHLIYAHPDLDLGVAEVGSRFGIVAAGGGRHLGRGTHNRLLALGPRTYLEIIAPDPGQPEPPGPRPYGVEGISRGTLVGWALAVEDIDSARADALARGFDPGQVVDGHREDSSGRLLRWRATANAQVAGVIPFLISWGSTPHPAADAPQGLRLKALRVECPEPTKVSGALAAMGAEVQVLHAPSPALVALIDGPTGERELR
ncbi:VOC family protein [Nocardioides sp. NPDC051685]|uniref:VOC family protein n=1 Tax=Nocardioides sp. NPDC051685 TaxID=3364334 RepID=UPI0037A70721